MLLASGMEMLPIPRLTVVNPVDLTVQNCAFAVKAAINKIESNSFFIIVFLMN
jgi:hypothetical protein